MLFFTYSNHKCLRIYEFRYEDHRYALVTLVMVGEKKNEDKKNEVKFN